MRLYTVQQHIVSSCPGNYVISAQNSHETVPVGFLPAQQVRVTMAVKNILVEVARFFLELAFLKFFIKLPVSTSNGMFEIQLWRVS